MACEDDDPAERASIGSSPDLNRAVYERFLSSDYPEALRLANVILEREPLDSVARAVRAQCIDMLASDTTSGDRLPDASALPETLECPVPGGLASQLASQPASQEDEHVEELGDDDIVSVEGEEPEPAEAFTGTDLAPHEPSAALEEPTSPTLSLDRRGGPTREVYRLFLASEYASALDLADELLAQGHDDSILVSVARECRLALQTRSSIPAVSAEPEMVAHLVEGDVDPRAAELVSWVDGELTIEQLAEASGMPLDDVVGVLERFVAMGAVTFRAPPWAS